jgi:hypothetical protein
MMTSEEFWAILHNMPKPKPVFMRLYHSEQGEPICYSMDDLPGNYIDVDAETYARSPMNLRVINGQIKYINTTQGEKLVPSDTGYCCYPNSVDIVVTEQEPHTKWSKRIYETD